MIEVTAKELVDALNNFRQEVLEHYADTDIIETEQCACVSDKAIVLLRLMKLVGLS